MKFSAYYWRTSVEAVGQLLQMDNESLYLLHKDNLFKLATALPWLAQAPDWQREGLSNLLMIVTISVPGAIKNLFSHSIADDNDILHRLYIFLHPDGDLTIQKRGIALMALVMLNDYWNDQQIDKMTKKYNPILAGSWDYALKRKELISIIKSKDCPLMDNIFSLDCALSRNWWYKG